MNALTQAQRSQLLLDNAHIGWWEAYFKDGYFICSDYLLRLFNRKDEKLPFEEFRLMIREDYRYRITCEFASVKHVDIYEEIFPIATCFGIQWVRSKLCRRIQDANGRVEALGFIEVLSDQGDKRMDQKARTGSLLNHLGSLSRALYSFVQTSDLQHSIDKILTEILNSFGNSGRVYIMEYDYEHYTLLCPYEICSEGVLSSCKKRGITSLDQMEWSMSIITNLHPVILNTLEELPPEAEGEKILFEKDSIASLLLIPMNIKNKVFGFMGIDIVGTPRMWSTEDYQWLSSIANVISICIELVVSQEKVKKERNNLDRALKALDQSEKMLRNLYTNMPVGLELYDKDGYLIELNNKDMEIFGVQSPHEALGINLFENPIVPADVLEKINKHEPVTFRLNYPFKKVGDYYITAKKEETLDISTRISMLYDAEGALINYIVLNLDNTEKTIAYNRIEEFENFFSLISEFAKIGYAKFDLITCEGSAISQWYRNLGEEDGTPLSHIVGIYTHVHEDDRAIMIDFFEKVKRGEADNIRQELRISNGESWRWIRVNVMRNPLNTNPAYLEMICINYDITELKENQLQREKAEELDRLKSAFLANMSHEIRTPLNAIVGFSSLLTDTNSQEEQKEFMEIIQKNNDLLLQLISDILDLSKIEAGTMQFKISPVDIHNLLEELVASFRIKLPEGVQIDCTPDLPPCTTDCDKVRLTQVLANFINNAIKYTSEGAILLDYRVSPEAIKFTVTDTGEGMSEEVQAHIFDRFYKGDSFKQGTGLGLSICEMIIRKLGGEIGVTSTLGEGSCFWFTIPRKIQAEAVQ